ncbi:reverse transcriptase [Tanacetum coccineum]
MISPTQGAFVLGRQITDNIVIVHEVLHLMRKKQGQKGSMAIKIDLAKAYDRLQWDFIRDTLFETKIPPLLVEIIMLCVTTPSMKILWNGETTEEFRPSRGIRQGDPLSPYIFVMCMKRLNHLIEVAVKGGELVSFHKSRIYFFNNVHHELADEVSEILRIDHTDDLGYYLGMPTINGRVTKATFQNIINKVDKRLSGWKTKWSDDEKQIHLLSWNTLQKDRKEGGLGIRSMRQANAALLTKLGWRLLAKPNSLWSQVLRSKYCKGRCDLDMFSSKKNSSNVWQGLVENAKIVRHETKFSVGNGRRTLFWDHCWATKTPLSSMAMSPILIEAQDRTLEEYWSLNGHENDDWKWEELSIFLSGETLKMISTLSVNPSCEVENSMYWGGSTIGKYSVKSAINFIRNKGDVQHDRKRDLVWKAPLSECIRMFIWLALHACLLSNVQRVARKLSDDPRCTRCGAEEESLDHILLRCPFSFITWNKLSYHPPNSSFWTLPLCE